MRSMRRLVASFLAGLMVLMPMSVLAGYCPAPAEQQEMPCHQQDEQAPVEHSSDACADMQNCCGGCLTVAPGNPPALAAMPEHPFLPQASFAGFVPDQLDPPPVVL